MKRSEINKALKELEAMCEKEHCYLPPFCHFTPEQWQTIGHEYDEVRDCNSLPNEEIDSLDRMQVTKWPGSISSKEMSHWVQVSVAWGHRAAKRQPGLGLMGW